MTAIAAAFSSDGRPWTDSTAMRMLAAARSRGDDRSAIWRGDGALIALSRAEWELAPGFAGDAMLLVTDDIVVAADAAIYYRDDLRRTLARNGVAPEGDSASHLIAAAYRVWGDACAEQLEGDFAFVIWDRRRQRLCAARDFSGKRTLFYAVLEGVVIVASTVGAVLAHPDCPDEIDLAVVASCAGGLFADDGRTAYRAVRTVPAGWTILGHSAGMVEERRHWSPPPMEHRADIGFDEAASTLRTLLERSVAERISPGGETSIWLSGGWDSTAVFGIGQSLLRAQGGSRSLHPVSMSYPPGDPGREDELISAVAAFWGVPVRWVDIRDVPFLSRIEESAAERDDPFAHPFEMWNRMLARGSRAVGAHVALEGVGGDQLFQVSHVYLADLLRTGRWWTLAREWRENGMHDTGFRNFFRWAIQPVLPAPALRVAELLRGGRPLVGYLERRPPSWLARGFLERHQLAERERAAAPQRTSGSCVVHETTWYLTYRYFPRVFGTVSAFALDEGVEIRSPLYDRRVIEFALTRPRWERSSGRETKRLLRAAVRGLLPDEVLAPRPARTGVTGGFFTRSMREHFPRMCDELRRESVLADYGMIDAYEFQQTAAAYLRGETGEQVGINLFFTLQAEHWLRARMHGTSVAASDGPGEVVAAMMRQVTRGMRENCKVYGHGGRNSAGRGARCHTTREASRVSEAKGGAVRDVP
jgi:asparagine synthase (glutamine-hydrolysing)